MPRQEVLWNKLKLDTYSRIYPIEDSRTPYFNLYQNHFGAFTYSPFADEKFAFLIPDSFGLFCKKSGNRFFGAYGNDLESTLLDTCHVDEPKILSLLCKYEPSAVWQYEEPRLIDRLNKMIQETNARPFLFNKPDGTTLVSLPEEVHDYLSLGECKLAEQMLVLQESANNDPTPSDQPVSQPDEGMTSDAFIPQMSI